MMSGTTVESTGNWSKGHWKNTESLNKDSYHESSLMAKFLVAGSKSCINTGPH